jgi:hypothetical protein
MPRRKYKRQVKARKKNGEQLEDDSSAKKLKSEEKEDLEREQSVSLGHNEESSSSSSSSSSLGKLKNEVDVVSAGKELECIPLEDDKNSQRTKNIDPSEKETSVESITLEKGHIYFFYRAKIDVEEVNDLRGVQRLYILLAAQKHFDPLIPEQVLPSETVYRLIIVGQKKMPSIELKSRYWGFVELVTKDLKEVNSYLGMESYHTETVGDREIEPARPCGEGVYQIVKHHAHTHLAFVLEVPEEMGEVQDAFNLHKEGSYIISIKNPEISSKLRLQYSKKADFPKELIGKFQGKRFIPVQPTSLLNYPGVELIIIGATEAITDELGKAGEELEELEKMEMKRLDDEKLFNELRMNKAEHPAEPLIKGEWK